MATNRSQYMKEIQRVIDEGYAIHGPGVKEEPVLESTTEIGRMARAEHEKQRIKDQSTGARIQRLFKQINSKAPVDKQLTTILPEPIEQRTQVIPEPIEIPLEKVANQDTIAIRKSPKDLISERKTEKLKVTKEAKQKPVNFQKLQDEVRSQQLAQLTQVQRIGQNISKIGQQVEKQTASWPVFPGGIALPLTILFVLVMLLLPVNGQTRIMWLWKTITGTALVQPTTYQAQQPLAQVGGPTGKGSGLDTMQGQQYSYSSYYITPEVDMDEY